MGCDIVFDQINALVSKLREWKVFQEKIKFEKNGD